MPRGRDSGLKTSAAMPRAGPVEPHPHCYQTMLLSELADATGLPLFQMSLICDIFVTMFPIDINPNGYILSPRFKCLG